MTSSDSRKHEGGCQCGAVRLRFTGTPLTVYACHCTRCQTRTGSAFGLSMHVPAEAVEFVSRPPTDVSWPGERVAQYCDGCRTLLAMTTRHRVTCLFPGCFDDTAWFRPVANVWVRSAQPWVHLDPSLKTYQTQPDDWTELWVQKAPQT